MTVRELRVVVLILMFVAHPASAGPLPAGAWPSPAGAALDELGSGVAVVFSPDLTVAGTCDLYTLLGFSCFAEADWNKVLERIATHNASGSANAIRTVVLETHGTNGNGLKLQEGYEPTAWRSYISVGGLQERLDAAGVRFVTITACNAGRLVRPQIYRRLDRSSGDPLFLPAMLGVIDAGDDYDAKSSGVTILARTVSQVEIMIVARFDELAAPVQVALRTAAASRDVLVAEEFVISDFMMQITTDDPALDVEAPVPTEKVSRVRTTAAESDVLFARFLQNLARVVLPDRTDE